MKLKALIIILFGFVCFSCFKKTNVQGVVYSKYNVPLPNVYVSYEGYGESSYYETKTFDVAKTDNNGHYQFQFTAKKKYSYKVVCITDSGSSSRGISYGKANKLDLHLK